MLNFDLIQLMLLMVATLGGMVFFIEWKKTRHEDREFKRDEFEFKKNEMKYNSDHARINVHNQNITPEESKTDLNGYVFIAVAEDKKQSFTDLLSGFEEYAKLKGYHVSLSIDKSMKNKVGFKFTLHEEGVSVGTQKVKDDISEYIDRVMSGGDFENIPILITPEEHAVVIGTLKARLKYMEYAHELDKEHKEFYQKVIHSMADRPISHQPANINLIQEGIGMDQRSYSANGSANVIQGDENKNIIEHSNIQIGENVSEINSRLEILKEVMQLLENEATANHQVKPAIRYLENTKEELEDNKTPDGSLVAKWLGKANSVIKTGKATAETISKFSELLNSFGISF